MPVNARKQRNIRGGVYSVWQRYWSTFVSGIWVVRECRKGMRVPQDQSRVQLVGCRLARARRAQPHWGSCWKRGETWSSPWIGRPCQALESWFPTRPPLFIGWGGGGTGTRDSVHLYWRVLLYTSIRFGVDQRDRMVLYHSEAWSPETTVGGNIWQPTRLVSF